MPKISLKNSLKLLGLLETFNHGNSWVSSQKSRNVQAAGQNLGRGVSRHCCCADEKRAQESYGYRGKTLYCLQDTAVAIQNILLTACSLGFGTCWIGAFKEDEVRKVINAPPEMRPIALISVGYPNEAPKARHRRPVSEIMHKETF
jgi:hypothetical protein